MAYKTFGRYWYCFFLKLIIFMYARKLIHIDDSIGFILPPELMSLLKVGENNMVSMVETVDGITLMPYEVEVDEHPKS